MMDVSYTHCCQKDELNGNLNWNWNTLHFMKPEGTWLHSQSPTTCPSLEQDQSSPCSSSHIVKLHFNITLPQLSPPEHCTHFSRLCQPSLSMWAASEMYQDPISFIYTTILHTSVYVSLLYSSTSGKSCYFCVKNS
jgi:hypothetical protein